MSRSTQLLPKELPGPRDTTSWLRALCCIGRSNRALCALFLIAATVFVYLPCLHGRFLFDDSELITGSKIIKSPDGLRRIWFTTEAPEYYPISYSAMWLEWRLWEMSTTGYHVANLLFHIGSALLIWRILHRLDVQSSYFAAMLFALHPVNIESVAWISQIRNVSALFFFLASLSLFPMEHEIAKSPTPCSPGTLGTSLPKIRRYWLSFAVFVVSMLCKGSAAVLPAILLVLFWWNGTTNWKRALILTAPFFAIAIVLTLVNIWFQTHGEHIVVRHVTLADRFAGAGAIIWFYLSKALLPIDLLFIYPQWDANAKQVIWWLPLLAALGVSGLLYWRRNSQAGRSLWFAWLYFCAALVPVLGFADVGFMRYSLVADHYQYFAIIAVAALTAASWNFWNRRASGVWRWIADGTALVVVVGLAALTWQTSSYYSGPEVLYRETLKKNPNCWALRNNLARYWQNRRTPMRKFASIQRL